MKLSNANYDIVKIVLSLMVVAIHSVGTPLIYPWVRTAVPLFFILSSYFFFRSIDGKDYSDQKKSLVSFVKRNLRLYMFWFICLFPITLEKRQYFSDGYITGLKTILKFGLFNSTFVASWFIMALVLATIIIFLLSYVLPERFIIILSLFANCYSVLHSSYLPFLGGIDLFSIYRRLFIDPSLNFTVALFWVATGRWFVHNNIKIKHCYIGIAVSVLLLFAEWGVLFKLTGSFNNDCYFMLIPVCIYAFGLIKSIKPHFNNSFVDYRKMTAITFASHGSIIYLLNKYIPMPGVIRFIAVVIICFVLGKFILWLEKYKPLKWLKYSH